jgi:hypothetical protein
VRATQRCSMPAPVRVRSSGPLVRTVDGRVHSRQGGQGTGTRAG